MKKLSLSNPQRTRQLAGIFNVKSKKILKFNNQDYWKIRKECLRNGQKFIDATFDLIKSVENLKELNSVKNIKLQRASTVCEQPLFRIDKSRCVAQGVLGNCWLIAAVSSLASNKQAWQQVVPYYKKQKFNEKNYAGIFVFRLWHFGVWIEIVVDDYLPTVNNKLIFARSEYENEFWCGLLEKAYAKFCNGYNNLNGGHIEALLRFTGGIPEFVNLNSSLTQVNELWEKLKLIFNRQSLMTANIDMSDENEIEFDLPNGLVKGHSYAITGFYTVEVENKKENLIRLLNPWGKREWNGKWSKNSQVWEMISTSTKAKIDLRHHENGEFWMEFQDFCLNFNELVFCYDVDTSFLKSDHRHTESLTYGQWRSPDRTGGWEITTFLSNPQYRFDVTKTDGDDVVLCLIQKNKRAFRTHGGKNLHIGIYVTPIELNRKIRLVKLDTIENPHYETDIINSEVVLLRARLPYGRYCCVPHTFSNSQEGEFLLRIFTHSYCHLNELQTTIRISLTDPFFIPPRCVTTIRITSGSKIKPKYPTYIKIYCEDKSVTSKTVEPNTEPEWNVSGLFYRLFYEIQPIEVCLYAIDRLGKKLMGKILIDNEPFDKHVQFSLPLDTNNKRDSHVSGYIKSSNETFSI